MIREQRNHSPSPESSDMPSSTARLLHPRHSTYPHTPIATRACQQYAHCTHSLTFITRPKKSTSIFSVSTFKHHRPRSDLLSIQTRLKPSNYIPSISNGEDGKRRVSTAKQGKHGRLKHALEHRRPIFSLSVHFQRPVRAGE